MLNLPTIIGAGPVGLLLGCLLQKNGIKCQIFDRLQTPSLFSKALMIHSASIDILSQLDLSDEVIQAGLHQQFINFYMENGEKYSLDFNQLNGIGYPGYINLRQPLLEKILTNCFIDLGGKLYRDTNLLSINQKESSVMIRVKNGDEIHDLSIPWLVGCDGANSTVRKELECNFIGSDYEYNYVLAEGISDGNVLDKSSHMLINDSAALSVIPMENGELRIAGPGSSSTIFDDDLNNEQIEGIFHKTKLHNLPKIIKYTAIRKYSVRERVAEYFADRRVFLCGDAAHVHSPTGGQAMNLGFGDAFALAWRLTDYNDIHKIANEYSAERNLIANSVIKMTHLTHLINDMRNKTLEPESLIHITNCFSQLYHHWGDAESPLCSNTLSPGSRVPNLISSEGKKTWDLINPGWNEVGGSGDLGKTLLKYYKINSLIKIRPDFIVESVSIQ